MAVSRIQTSGFDLKGTGILKAVTDEGYLFQDDKGEDLIKFSEIKTLINQEITFTIKRTKKTAL